jgi:hypothetical protein
MPALAAVAGVLFGPIPVVRVMRANLSSVFREEGTGTASRSAVAVRGALVVAQVSIAFGVAHIGAGLMIASREDTRGESRFQAG